MLGSESLQDLINTSSSIQLTPRAFLEFNANDIAKPYFYGTGDITGQDWSSLSKTLSSKNANSPTPTNADSRGLQTALSQTSNAQLIDVSDVISRDKPETKTYYADGPVGVKSVKFNMFLKSDYKYQLYNNLDSNYLESFSVVLKAYGLDSSGKIITSEVVTKNIDVNSIDWTPVSVLFSNPDDNDLVNRVRLEINIETQVASSTDFTYGLALLVSQLTCAPISSYEVFVENRLPIKEVFELNRPGEFLVDMPIGVRPKTTVDGSPFEQQCTSTQMVMSYAIGPKYENLQRGVMPFEGNPYSYYVSGSTNVSPDSQDVWAIYEKAVATNKIVIKVNTLATVPDSFNVKILTSSGWSTDISATAQFDAYGILTLYYNGSSWTDVKWVDGGYAYISPETGDDVIMSGGEEVAAGPMIHGIYFECNSLSATNPDFSTLGGKNERLELIEMSPRLEIDVTNYLQSFDVIKEVDIESDVLPIGGISANSANVVLSNILVTVSEPDILVPSDGDPDVPPFSNFSPLSSLKDMLKKGVKVRGGFDVNTSVPVGSGSTKEYVPAFCMYVDEWKDSDFSLTISAFDVVKNLQTIKSRPVYIRGATIPEAIKSILDPIGFSDYYYDSLNDLQVMSKKSSNPLEFSINSKIPHFWTSKDLSVIETLSGIAKVFQIAVYADEYGAIKFSSLYEYGKEFENLQQSSRYEDFYIQDKNDSNSNSNLETVEFVENEKPESITIKYRIPGVGLQQPEANDEQGTNPSLISKARESTRIVWSLKQDTVALPYIYISGDGIRGSAQNWIPYNPIQSKNAFTYIPYASELLIDEEIVSYNGIEFSFRYTRDSGTKRNISVVVNKEEDINMIIRDLMANDRAKNIRYSETGKLMNVKRGLYGTTPSPHTRRSIAGNTRWRAKELTRSNSGYKNSVSVSMNSGKVSNTEYGIKLNSSSNNKMLFVYPNNDEDNSDILGNKRRLSAVFNIGDIPNKEAGYLGVAIGVKFDGNDIDSGLFVWFGKKENKKKKEPVVFVEQVVNGQIKTLVAKDDFEYSERLFEEGENLEIILSLNEKRDKCKVLIGGTSAFAKEVETKKGKDDEDPTKEYKDFAITLSKPLGKGSQFGLVSSHYASGYVGQYLFGVSRDPEEMNDLNIYNMPNIYTGYKKKKRASKSYFIGENTLLENIVGRKLVPGFNDAASDNFVYTANPVARGLKVFEVDYDTYPVTSVPDIQFLGYTYEVNSWQDAPLFGSTLADSEDN